MCFNYWNLSGFQIRFLLSTVHELSGKWGGAPVVLAGDFNSTPQVWYSNVLNYIPHFSVQSTTVDKIIMYFLLVNRVQFTSSCHHLRSVSYKLLTRTLFYHTRGLLDIWCCFYMQLNVRLYERREISGQRSCHPTQVLGPKQGFISPLILIDGYFLTTFMYRYVLLVLSFFISIHHIWLTVKIVMFHYS